MREVDYTDTDGRTWRVRVPDNARPEDYPAGIVVGPPAGLDAWLEGRGWTEEQRIRLHNALHSRGLITIKEVMRRPQDVEGALKAVLKTDIQGIQRCYYDEASPS